MRTARKYPARRPKGHRSKFETRVELSLSKNKDYSYEYEKDRLPYTIEYLYTPDWTLTPLEFSKKNFEAPSKILLEAKGRFDGSERRKILAVLKHNPGIDLRMVFMRDQKITKASKTMYSTWCERHGIKYSIFPELPI